jgi:hypothetical protein
LPSREGLKALIKFLGPSDPTVQEYMVAVLGMPLPTREGLKVLVKLQGNFDPTMCEYAVALADLDEA